MILASLSHPVVTLLLLFIVFDMLFLLHHNLLIWRTAQKQL